MESLGVDVKLLIAQLINFGLFFFIFKKFIAKPFSKFLNIEVEKEKEKERILDGLRKKEEEMINQEKRNRDKMKEEFEETIKNAKKEALIVREELVTDAKKEAEEIIIRGKRQVDEERRTMEKDIKKRVVDLSILLVQKGLKDFLTDDVQKNLTRYILKNFSKS